MTKILAFAGKKQSGKNTLCNFLHGYFLKSFNIIDGFEITSDGQLIIDTLVVNDKGETQQGKGGIDVTRTDINFAMWAMDNMWPYVKQYGFANFLKDLAVLMFNIPREILYGTDAQKNELCQYKWEDMPTKTKGKSGPMTYREFMQYFGKLCRKIYPEIWVNRTITDILEEDSNLAIISDLRHYNELEAVKKVGGKVVRLLRQVDDDSDDSETELDNCNDFDAVIDNRNMTINESCKELFSIIDSWGWIPKEIIIQNEAVYPKKERFTSIK